MTSRANLPLRRRCLFLVDMGFVADEFAQLAASADHRTALQSELVRVVDTAVTDAAGERRGLEGPADAHLDAVDDALATLQTSIPKLGATGETAARFFYGWEDAIESLLCFLDEVAAAELSTSSSGLACPALSRIGEVVRHALCGLIGALYADGKRYFDTREDAEEAEYMASRGPTDNAANACSWSIAAPVAADVYGFFDSACRR